MMCKCYWSVLYTVHVTAFCLGGGVFSRTLCINLHVKSSLFGEDSLELNFFRPSCTTVSYSYVYKYQKMCLKLNII